MSSLGIRTAACARSHTGKVGSRWVLGEDTLVAIIAANGMRQVRAHCPDCGSQSGNIPYASLPMSPNAYPVIRDNVGRYGQQPCAVRGCGNPYTEYHHFAPPAVFSRRLTELEQRQLRDLEYLVFDESDLWPTAYLCRVHHHEWHQRMVGYRWNRAS